MVRLAVAPFLIAILQSYSSVNAIQVREPSAGISPSQAATLVRSVIETVLREHVDPPTRQQMVLATANAFAQKQGQPRSLELSPMLSDAKGAEDVYQILLDELNKSKETSIPIDLVQETLQTGLGTMLLGGLAFETRKNVQAEEQVAANRYVGIGVVLSAHDVEKGMQFIKVHEGGPASDGGIIEMDVLEAVNGNSTKDRSIGDVIQLLRGPIDTVVKVMVRTGAEPARELSLVRRVVRLTSLELKETNIGKKALLILVDRFTASSINELQNLVEEAEKGVPAGEKIDTIVLDMQRTVVDNLHYFHLFADGILDDAKLCQVQTRKGIRTLKTEEGTALNAKRFSILFTPGHAEAIDILAQSLGQAKLPAYFFYSDLNGFVLPLTGDYFICNSIEVPGADFFIKTATSRLLNADGQPLSPDRLGKWKEAMNHGIEVNALIKEGRVLDAIFSNAARTRKNKEYRMKP